MKNFKKTIMILLTVAVLLIATFAAGRYGWKLPGLRACRGTGIESVEVSENTVKIKEFCPGSFPEVFCSYYAEEQNSQKGSRQSKTDSKRGKKAIGSSLRWNKGTAGIAAAVGGKQADSKNDQPTAA